MVESHVTYRRVSMWVLVGFLVLLLANLGIGVTALVKASNTEAQTQTFDEILAITSVENGAIVSNTFATSNKIARFGITQK